MRKWRRSFLGIKPEAVELALSGIEAQARLDIAQRTENLAATRARISTLQAMLIRTENEVAALQSDVELLAARASGTDDRVLEEFAAGLVSLQQDHEKTEQWLRDVMQRREAHGATRKQFSAQLLDLVASYLAGQADEGQGGAAEHLGGRHERKA